LLLALAHRHPVAAAGHPILQASGAILARLWAILGSPLQPAAGSQPRQRGRPLARPEAGADRRSLSTRCAGANGRPLSTACAGANGRPLTFASSSSRAAGADRWSCCRSGSDAIESGARASADGRSSTQLERRSVSRHRAA
jgi:hypothetical protein